MDAHLGAARLDAIALARALKSERGGEPVGHGGGSHREFPKIGRLRCRAVSRFAGTRGAAGLDVARCARAIYRVIRGCETRTRSSTLVPNGKVWLGCVRVRRCVRSCARLETDMLVTCSPNPAPKPRGQDERCSPCHQIPSHVTGCGSFQIDPPRKYLHLIG